MGKLIPRMDTGAALRRLQELENAVRRGDDLKGMVAYEESASAPNTSGGTVIRPDELLDARRHVLADLDAAETENAERDERSRRILRDAWLGRSLNEHLPLIPADAGHNEVWVFLNLMVFPDILLERWPLSSSTGLRPSAKRAVRAETLENPPDWALPKDRWIGLGVGRDRNHLRTQWRRWRLLGEILLGGDPPLGEDEMVALTERSSMARNADLVRLCARAVLEFSLLPAEGRRDRFGQALSRSDFARLLGRAVVLHTGPRMLDVLPPGDLEVCVREATLSVLPKAQPWLAESAFSSLRYDISGTRAEVAL